MRQTERQREKKKQRQKERQTFRQLGLADTARKMRWETVDTWR